MHKLGGISSGLDIFNLAILPAFIYNAETWLDLPKQTLERLETLQNTLLRCLLGVPVSAPTPALHWDVGQLSMEHKVNVKKLTFSHYLSNLDDSVLAKEIFTIQKELKFPGFLPEIQNLIEFYDLPNIIDENCVLTKGKWTSLVKEAIKSKYEEELKDKMLNCYSKLKNSKLAGNRHF